MSVETGIPPQALVELDEPMWHAILGAHARRWTVADELAAQTVELTSGVLSVLVNVHRKKGSRPVAPVTVPRPSSSSQRSASSSRTASAGTVGIVEYATLEGLTIERPSSG